VHELLINSKTYFVFQTERSAILRDKLKDSKENKDGKVVLKLEEDVALEVIDHFLTFIYSGRLKDTRKDRHSAAPVWIECLPELVQLAVKVGNPLSIIALNSHTLQSFTVKTLLFLIAQYEVEDLVDFCDLNLHRVALVSPVNAAEILCLAKRLNLKRTLEKLRTAFSK